MDIEVRPHKAYNTSPFHVTVPYQESARNLLYMISLTLTTANINQMVMEYQGKRIRNLDAKLSELGFTSGTSIELLKGSKGCCMIF
ncbi:hypothetical protein SteCoe_21048 [Stentor coeruleus]|uniref:Ubiquitin-like domain-containing protein n=1 Tax=Stentor coeruleus TaxID=5963 RepID=A0A1R2BQL1_9CILI|nr:hypothetical protein SteCoe_21048 [Stentor coeruleus]